MYNKHQCMKRMFQATVDNKIVMEFNTAKKREAFVKIARRSGRQVTCTAQVCYPWNPEDGLHNLMNPSELASLLDISRLKITRAVTNGFLKTEPLGDKQYVVINHDHFELKGIEYKIPDND